MRRILFAFILAALSLATLPLSARGEGLPQVSITGEHLTGWRGKSDERAALLSYDDGRGTRFTSIISIHIQGFSSTALPKLNYTIKFQKKAEMIPGWGAHKKYTLKANYNDPTLARNIVSSRLAAQMQRRYGLFEAAPNAGQIDGFPVRLVINGKPAGLYTWNMPREEWLFGMDEGDENHLLFFGRDWTNDIIFAAEAIDYDNGWAPANDDPPRECKAKFERLYRFIRDSSDEVFRADIGQYLDLDACLNYCCFCCVAFAADNTGKNMILGTYDGLVWWPSLYDLDETWGNCWDADLYRERKDALSTCPGLLMRIRQCFPEELAARYRELRDSVLSMDNIRAEFERFREQIPRECFDENRALWYPDGCPYPDYDELYTRIDEYLPFYDAYFGYEK